MFRSSLPTPPLTTSDVDIIILTASGGAGHLSAAKAKELAYQGSKKTLTINVIEAGWLNFEWITKQSVIGVIGKLPFVDNIFLYNFGEKGVSAWNAAQKSGDLSTLEKLINQQPLAEEIFKSNFYSKMTTLLAQHPKVERVITTQPLCIPDLHHAIADFNRIHHRDIAYTVILTDLPTEKAVHFIHPLRLIADSDLQAAKLSIEVPYPATKKYCPCLEDYHQAMAALCAKSLYLENTSIPKKNVNIEFTHGPIDPCFLAINQQIRTLGVDAVRTKYRLKSIPLQFTPAAYNAMYDTAKKPLDACSYFIATGSTTEALRKTKFVLPFGTEVMTLMLGSQASLQGTLDIIDWEYLLHKKYRAPLSMCLFVFCGDDTQPNSLFQRVCEKAREYRCEGTFIVVPLTNQNKDTISHLYTVADLSVSRLGGMSVMELEAVANGKVIAFAETSDALSKEKLSEDPTLTLIIWEKGNGEHLSLTLGEDRVSILNKYLYQSGRIKHFFHPPQSVPSRPVIRDPALAKSYRNNEEIVAQCRALLAKRSKLGEESIEQQEMRVNAILIGSALFTHIFKQIVHPDSLQHFAFFYAMGCELVQKGYTLATDYKHCDTIQHPHAWALRYAKCIHDLVKKLKNDQISTAHEAFVAAYVDAFYEPNLHIIASDEAFIYAEAYIAAPSKEEESRTHACQIVQNRRQKIDEISAIVDVNVMSDLIDSCKYQSFWDKGKNTIEKITLVFKDYISPNSSYASIFAFHPLRHHRARAEEVIQGVEKFKDQPLDALLQYLLTYKRQCAPDVNQVGSFIRRLNYVIRKIVAADLYQYDEKHMAQIALQSFSKLSNSS